MTRLVYAEPVRMPTEKAHGFQIAKMCEAFARAGMEVELWHARRHQPDPAMVTADVFGTYGVERCFAVRSFPGPELIRFATAPGLRWTRNLYLLQQAWTVRAVARAAAGVPPSRWYTRNVEVALALTRRSLPVGFEVHTVPDGPTRSRLRRLASRPSLGPVVAITSPMAEELADLGFSRIITLPDAADLDSFANLPDREEARRRLGLPLDRPIVGFVGRFTIMGVQKGLPELVEAMGTLSADRGEPLLVAIGGPMDAVPPYLERAAHAGTPASRLRFVDRVPNAEVPTWIAAFDVAAVTPPDHPLHARYVSPLKLFEYLAAGRAIVASDLPALRDVVRHDDNAWLVRPGDPASIADGIQRLLADPALRERLGRRAREDARRYTWNARAAAVIAAMEER